MEIQGGKCRKEIESPIQNPRKIIAKGLLSRLYYIRGRTNKRKKNLNDSS